MRPTHGAHLDPNDITLVEETAPGALPIRRTGQFLHATAHHVLHRLSLMTPVQNTSRMIYFHNASGIWSGNPEFLRLSLALRATGRSCGCSEHTLEKGPPWRVHAAYSNAFKSTIGNRPRLFRGRHFALLRNLAKHAQK